MKEIMQTEYWSEEPNINSPGERTAPSTLLGSYDMALVAERP
jgi:hypothetical protein